MFKFISIKYKIAFPIITSLIVGGAIISLITYTLVRDYNVTVQGESLYSLATSKAQFIEEFISQKIQTINQIANDVELKDFLETNEVAIDFEHTIEDLLTFIDQNEALNIIEIYDNEGSLQIGLPEQEEGELSELIKQTPVYSIGGTSYRFSDIYPCKSIGENCLALQRDVFGRSGDKLGVSIIEIDLSVINKNISDLENTEDYVNISILDTNGNSLFEERIFSNIKSKEILNKCLYSGESLGGFEKNFSIVELNNNEQDIVSQVLSRYPGWCVVATAPSNLLLTPFYRSVNLFLFWLVIFVSILSGIAYLVGAYITQPISKLKYAAEKIRAGSLNFKKPIDTNDELEVLADTLEITTARLNTFYEELDKGIKQKTKEIEVKLKDIELQNAQLDKSKTALLNILQDVEESNRELEKTKSTLTKAVEELDLAKYKAEKQAIELTKFQKAVENSTDHIVITDRNGIIIYANKAVEKITGFTHDEVINKKAGGRDLWGGMMPKEFYKDFWETIAIEKKPFAGEIQNRRKNGEIYSALVSISPILNEENDIEAFVGIERDITETKRKEEAIAKLAAIVSNSSEAIISQTIDGIITSWNRGAFILYGYKEEEVLNKHISIIYPKDKAINDNDIEVRTRVIKGEVIRNHETKRIRKDGVIIDVGITFSPILDSSGNVIAIGAIARDITEAKKIDKAKTEFVSLASHQLRTPLSAINWYTEMLLNKDAGVLNQGQKEFVEEIAESNKRMITLVNALLNVSRIDMGTFMINPQKTNLYLVADSVFKELEPVIKEKQIKIEKNYEADSLVIDVDPDLIHIVLENLIANAVKYTPAKGKVSVSIKNDTSSVEIIVKDTGYGIPESEQDKIFNKLYRASNILEKDVEGTGLGLYIVKSIVDQSNGKIWFESKVNKGTTFHVTLPISGLKKKKTGSRKLELG